MWWLLRHISFWGSLPIPMLWNRNFLCVTYCKRKRESSTDLPVRFSRLSFITSLTFGMILFVAFYGYVRLTNSVGLNPQAFKHMKTNELVVFSMTVTIPGVAAFTMLCQIFKAPEMSKFIGRLYWTMKKRHVATPRGAKVVMIAAAILYTALPFQVLGPSIGGRRKFSAEHLRLLRIGDALYWLIATPGLTASSFIFSYTTFCIAHLFGEISKKIRALKKQRLLWSRLPDEQEFENICSLKSVHPNLMMKRSSKDEPYHQRSENYYCQLLHEIKIFHDEVLRLSHKCCDVFAPSLVFTFMFFCLELCMFVYDITISILFKTEGAADYHTIKMKFVFAFIFTALIVMTNEAGHAFLEKTSECPRAMTRELIELQMQNRFTTADVDKLRSFASWLKTGSHQCHASHFFIFSRQTVVAVTGAILTYIIILVQFKNSEPKTF